MAAPSATTSFTFAPKQKQKQSARHPKQNGRVGGGRNHGKTEARGADRSGGNEDDGDNGMGPESDEEEIVVCSFGHSSKVVDAWMKKATQGWKEADMRADRKQNQAAEAFSNLIAGQQVGWLGRIFFFSKGRGRAWLIFVRRFSRSIPLPLLILPLLLTKKSCGCIVCGIMASSLSPLCSFTAR
jgi:hypothetical protein